MEVTTNLRPAERFRNIGVIGPLGRCRTLPL
jgi:hypothetical protein